MTSEPVILAGNTLKPQFRILDFVLPAAGPASQHILHNLPVLLDKQVRPGLFSHDMADFKLIQHQDASGIVGKFQYVLSPVVFKESRVGKLRQQTVLFNFKIQTSPVMQEQNHDCTSQNSREANQKQAGIDKLFQYIVIVNGHIRGSHKVYNIPLIISQIVPGKIVGIPLPLKHEAV